MHAKRKIDVIRAEAACLSNKDKDLYGLFRFNYWL